jgi:hypothetical protein
MLFGLVTSMCLVKQRSWVDMLMCLVKQRSWVDMLLYSDTYVLSETTVVDRHVALL